MLEKICHICKESLPIDKFGKNLRNKDGLHNYCKSCNCKKTRAWQLQNPEKTKEIYKSWEELNKSKISERKKARYQENKEKERARRKEYSNRIKEIFGVSPLTLRKRRDKQVWLRSRLRARMACAISRWRTAQKSATNSAIRDLGCTIQELLERFDQECLRKYGEPYSTAPTGKYHIDHRRPLASFDLTDPEQRAQALHFTNLQILTAEENLRKGAKH